MYEVYFVTGVTYDPIRLKSLNIIFFCNNSAISRFILPQVNIMLSKIQTQINYIGRLIYIYPVYLYLILRLTFFDE